MKKILALFLSLAFVSALAVGADKPAVKAIQSKSVSEPAAVTNVAKVIKVSKKSKKTPAVKAASTVIAKPAVK